MSTLFFDHSGFEVSARGESLVFVCEGQPRACYPARLVDRVVLQGSHIIHTSALSLLARHGASVLLLSGRQGRHVATISGPAHNDASLRLCQYRLASDPVLRATWSSRLLLFKLRSQRATLRRILAERPNLRRPFFQPLGQLRAAILDLAAACAATGSIPGIAQLRGMEGAAARAYFSAYSSAFAPALNFVGRQRRPPLDPVNVCLSLVYTLLTHQCEAAAHCAGLDPAIGFYHHAAFGRPALACDLVEPLRAAADFWVWSLFDRGILRPEHFQSSSSTCHFGKGGRSHFYLAFGEISSRSTRHLRRHCALLARHIRSAVPMPQTLPANDFSKFETDLDSMEASK